MESESQPASRPLPGPRGVFFEEDDALHAQLMLGTDGWQTHLARGRFQGEDDDEDQPWILTTDAPPMVLEFLTDEHNGWYDEEPPVQTQVPPLPPMNLPTQPKRIKRLGSDS